MTAAETGQDSAFMEIAWTDPVTGTPGYVVIDSLSRGVASGGLRMRAGCTLDEVRGLADAMTKKEAIHLRGGLRYVPVGGAKGGIDLAPQAPDAPDVLERFLCDMRPIIETYWAVGEDLGVRQDVIDEIFERRELGSPVQAVTALLDDGAAADERQRTAFAVEVDGVPQDELVGGLGVAEAALTALRHLGRQPDGASAVVQGFGSMGGAAAKFLAEAGVRIIGVVDADGMVRCEAGLDIEALLAARDHFGRIDRQALPEGAEAVSGERWLETECDVLVPAAISGCITAVNQSQIRAGVLVEAANLPVTSEAEAELAARGIPVIPDFIANSGTNAWWWWLTFGDIDGSWAESESMVRRRLFELTSEMLERADARELTPREAGLELARERRERLSRQSG